jgi:hypothetical protein
MQRFSTQRKLFIIGRSAALQFTAQRGVKTDQESTNIDVRWPR